MNDLKSDLFPRLGCLQGDAARKGEESGPRGRRVHLGRVFGEYSGGAPLLGSSHHASNMDGIFHS